MRKLHHTIVSIVALLFLICGIFLSGCEREPQEIEINWIEDTFSTMTDEHKIGQLFCLTVDPIRYFLYPDYKRNINMLIGKYKPGALYLVANLDTVKLEIRTEFNGNKLHDELIEIQKISDIPLFVAADFGSGAWYWDKKATQFPFPIALGAARSEQLAYRQGKITAVEAKAQGINWLFAPTINASIDQKNIDLQMQSLGNDPALAGVLGAQFIKGCQETGIAACLKYFPCEKNLSLLTMSSEDIDMTQLDAFKSGIDAGVLSIMGSPITPSRSDTTQQTLLPEQMLSGLLRNQLGFDGIFICDLVTAHESQTVKETSNILLEILKGGGTMFIVPETFDVNIPLIDAMLNGVHSGAVDMTPVTDAARKLLTIKNQLNLQLVKTERSLRAMAGIGLPEYHQTSRDIANQSVTLLKNEHNIIPVTYQNTNIFSIVFLEELSPHFATPYENMMSENSDTIKHLNIFGIPDERIQHEAELRAEEADVVVCSFFLYPDRDNHTPVLPPETENLMNRIIKLNDRVILVSFYDPYLINQFPEVQGYILPYSPSQQSMASAVDVIFGKRNAPGTLPIHISEEFPMGYGLE